ncbi:MAG: hypothetical protein GY705_05710 [Bacteroidetes bacterium]|nr:hypothetical protein [Bacteroidota bacterium]
MLSIFIGKSESATKQEKYGNKMIRKILIILSVVFTASIAMAASRAENEKILYEKMGIEAIVVKSIVTYKSEIIRLYPDLNQNILEQKYHDIFSRAETNFKNSYINAFSIYSDEELQKLVEFYNTEFGIWLESKSNEFNRQAQTNFEAPYIELNDSFQKRYYSKK